MNYYDVFNIPPTASSKEINDTHRELAKKYHPDINSSDDAHEKMTMLNEAYEVLSDRSKREQYDNKLKMNFEQAQSSQTASPIVKRANMRYGTEHHESRTEKAEMLRKKAEARLKAEEAERMMRTAQAKKRAEEEAKAAEQKHTQEKAASEKEQVIDLLSMLHRKSNARLRRNLETDEERHHAIKVLLSLVREDDSHLKRMAEEAERKQRIEEILELVKANKEEKYTK